MSSRKRKRSRKGGCSRNKSPTITEIVTERPDPILGDLELPPITIQKPGKRNDSPISMSIVSRIACVEYWLAGNNLDYYKILVGGSDYCGYRPICSSETFHRIWKEYGISIRARNGVGGTADILFYGNEDYILAVLKERFPEKMADIISFYTLFYQMLHCIPD